MGSGRLEWLERMTHFGLPTISDDNSLQRHVHHLTDTAQRAQADCSLHSLLWVYICWLLNRLLVRS